MDSNLNIKNIIFFGRTGSGKSTVSSMLYHKGEDKQKNCPFEVNDDVNGVTIKCNTRKSLDDKWKIFDTIGLGEHENGSIPHNEAINQINIFLKENMKESFHYVCIIKKKGRIDESDIKIKDVIKQLFKNEDLEKNLFLIITECEKEEWLNKEIRNGNGRKNKDIYQEIYNTSKIITVDFKGLDDEETENDEKIKEIRINSLKKLENYLYEYDNISPINSIIKEFKTEKEYDEISYKIYCILKYGIKKTIKALEYINEHRDGIIGGADTLLKVIEILQKMNE